MRFLKNLYRGLNAVLICSFGSAVCYAQDTGTGGPHTAAVPGVIENIPLPDAVTLCGEPLPLERRSVRERLDREFTIIVWDRPQVFLWLKRANRYFPYIEQQLARAGLPDDLKYLAVAESSLLTHARSPAGATGYWQFMPRTADAKGLRRDRLSDERYSLEHSTAAALRYLRQSFDMFGSWPLAMAAYNCGEKNVKRAIASQKVNDYYRLKLPNETERYVFRIAAIKIVLENHERYGYKISRGELYPAVECDTVELNIRNRIHIADLAIAAGTDYKTVRDLNPQFKGYYFPYGTCTLKVPAGLAPAFSEQFARFSAAAAKAAASKKYYKVRPGDTLSHIAERTGVPVRTLREINDLRGDFIRVGQKLRLSP